MAARHRQYLQLDQLSRHTNDQLQNPTRALILGAGVRQQAPADLAQVAAQEQAPRRVLYLRSRQSTVSLRPSS